MIEALQFTLMCPKTAGPVRFGWRLPLFAAIVGLIVFVPIATCQADTFVFVNAFIVVPALLAISVALVVYGLGSNGRRHLIAITATVAILWAIPSSLFLFNREHPFALRETARWLAWSREYERKVLAQPNSANGDLNHIEWDGSGFAGVANNTVFLVFDPADTLSAAAKRHQPGKFNGIPCDVRLIRRMESRWYAVLFYTDQTWEQCH
ncbi:MAG TPA: hypothetical protein VN862_03030 [Candidatus Acidoferrales bacterium]|nr:hypothetical protein [Candidatus Acidoferrales bacterium]